MYRLANPDNADQYCGGTPFPKLTHIMNKWVAYFANRMRENNVGPKNHFLIDQWTGFYIGPMTEAQCNRIILENPKRTLIKRIFNETADQWEEWLQEQRRKNG